jgi:hypothetical protein
VPLTPGGSPKETGYHRKHPLFQESGKPEKRPTYFTLVHKASQPALSAKED